MPPVMPTTRRLPVSSISLFCPTHTQELVEDQQSGACDDRRVGHVEGGPVPAAPVEVEKVDDVSVGDAVDDVADGTAEYQCQGAGEELLVSVPGKQVEDEHRRREPDDRQELVLPPGGGGEERKGRSLVVGEHQVEETCYRTDVAEAERALDDDLGQLVDENHQQCEC